MREWGNFKERRCCCGKRNRTRVKEANPNKIRPTNAKRHLHQQAGCRLNVEEARSNDLQAAAENGEERRWDFVDVPVHQKNKTLKPQDARNCAKKINDLRLFERIRFSSRISGDHVMDQAKFCHQRHLHVLHVVGDGVVFRLA